MMSFRKNRTIHRENTARQLETVEPSVRISSPVAALKDLRSDGNTHWIPLERITTRKQVREEFDQEELEGLARSFSQHEQQQACNVFWSEADQSFVIVSGERRFRAAEIAGKDALKCDVMDHEPTPEEMHELQLIENVQRKNLNAIEEARGYHRFVDEFGYTQQQIAERTGKSQAVISRALKLMQLPDEIRDELVRRKAPRSLAEALSRLNSIEQQRQLLDQHSRGEVTVRQASKNTSKRGGNRRSGSSTNKQVRVKKSDGIDLKATGKKNHTNTDYSLATLDWSEDLATDKKASVDKERVGTRCCNMIRILAKGANAQVTAVLLEELRNVTSELEQLERTAPPAVRAA